MERRQWNTVFGAPVLCLWKCYLSVAWAEPFQLWNPEAAVLSYKTVLRKSILNEKVLA
jgi:hypothetical protein